jgi:ribose transport system substrate-binding protein
VAQIEGQAGSPAAQQRIKGYKGEVAKHSNLKLVASVPADWDRQKALDAATNVLRANPNVKAFYANNDTMALGVVEAVRNAGKLGEILIVGTDGVPDAIKAVQADEMTGTVSSFPYNMGYLAVEQAVRLLEGQGVPTWVVSPMQMVTKDNAGEMCPDNKCRLGV